MKVRDFRHPEAADIICQEHNYADYHGRETKKMGVVLVVEIAVLHP